MAFAERVALPQSRVVQLRRVQAGTPIGMEVEVVARRAILVESMVFGGAHGVVPLLSAVAPSEDRIAQGDDIVSVNGIFEAEEMTSLLRSEADMEAARVRPRIHGLTWQRAGGILGLTLVFLIAGSWIVVTGIHKDGVALFASGNKSRKPR